MTTSTLCTIDGEQVLRLPESVAFPENVQDVEILKTGQSRVILPKGRRWDDFFLHVPQVSEDFLAERTQAVADQRDF